ncbi:hypothetical protein KIW84_041006 [Lathyrus oleraceus]|uniref:Uncharacterized protein n=1 Tax=Pisum sativum TaxID=3888 RepID=A0A9D4X6Z8_PEA|nr:hypothetical protein KIW84_041006 [Pisum sativum]
MNNSSDKLNGVYKLALFFIKPLDNRYLTTEALGISLFSRLNPNRSGAAKSREGSQPSCLIQKLMTASSLSLERSIILGFLLNASKISSWDQPHFIKTSTLASHWDLVIPLLANNATQKLYLEG